MKRMLLIIIAIIMISCDPGENYPQEDFIYVTVNDYNKTVKVNGKWYNDYNNNIIEVIYDGGRLIELDVKKDGVLQKVFLFQFHIPIRDIVIENKGTMSFRLDIKRRITRYLGP